MIQIGVVGANGKMGREVVKMVANTEDFNLVSAIDKMNTGENIIDEVYIEGDLEKALKVHNLDVVVDFTQPSVVFENVKKYVENGIKSVIGTTGLTAEQIEEIKTLSKEKNVGVLIAPNFSIGAILMMKFAAEASKYFSNAEIIEFHHNVRAM